MPRAELGRPTTYCRYKDYNSNPAISDVKAIEYHKYHTKDLVIAKEVGGRAG
jgi:hypothetical protein